MLNRRESKGIPEKHLLLFHRLHESLCVNHSKLWKILKEMGIPIFIGRTDAEVEGPILWPPDAKSQLIGKDPDARKD